MIGEDERPDTPQEPEATEPEAQGGEEQTQDQPEQQPEAEAPEETPAEEAPSEEGQPEEGAPDEPATEEAAPEEAAAEPDDSEPPPPKKRERKGKKDSEQEVIPGEHLEPDLVLEEERARQAGIAELAGVEVPVADEEAAEPGPEAVQEPAPDEVSHEPLDLAADARYTATGKRKSAVARVILRPGSGGYSVNGRELDEFFPRPRLQKIARQPLETAGYGSRMDVVAKIHGGGVSSQAGALRHGIARALVEADPSLRIELKRRGYLTRDPRRKERKKAGLKKARKRPQFSKR